MFEHRFELVERVGSRVFHAKIAATCLCWAWQSEQMSVQFHLVPGQRHAEIARDDILHALDRGVLELDDPAASLADEMIVMALADGLVTRLALVEMALVQQRAFLEQAQRPVNRRIADVRVDLLDLGVQFLGADMMPVVEEYARDIVALAGGLQPALLEAACER